MPLHARSFGSGLLTFLDMLSAFISVKLVPDLRILLETYGLFYLYSICIFLVLLVHLYIKKVSCCLQYKDKLDIYL